MQLELAEILDRWTALCTEGQVVSIGGLKIKVGKEEVQKFQRILSSFGAPQRCFAYTSMTLPSSHVSLPVEELSRRCGFANTVDNEGRIANAKALLESYGFDLTLTVIGA